MSTPTTPADLRDPRLAMGGSPPSPFASFRLGGLTLRNRIIKAATFEGMSPGARVSPALIAHHRALARGGVGMTTVAYCAVSPDGRTFADQLYMRPDLLPELRQLTDAVHAEGAAASLQLGHCGGFCNNRQLRAARPLAPSAGLNLLGALSGRPFSATMTAAEIEQTTCDFVQAARLAQQAGFDAVELHLGHGYLLSQFLCPKTNRRRDAWGGDPASRARFPLAVVQRVRAALPPEFPVLAKVNLRDGFPGGLELSESLDVARGLAKVGVTALVLSGGSVSRNAFYLFRGERPLRAMIAAERSLRQKLALTLFGPLVIRSYPYEKMYFLPLAREFRRALSLPLVLLGGIKDRADIEAGLAEGFDAVAMARALLHDPALIAKYQAGSQMQSSCIPCNGCIAEMERPGGVRCVRT